MRLAVTLLAAVALVALDVFVLTAMFLYRPAGAEILAGVMLAGALAAILLRWRWLLLASHNVVTAVTLLRLLQWEGPEEARDPHRSRPLRAPPRARQSSRLVPLPRHPAPSQRPSARRHRMMRTAHHTAAAGERSGSPPDHHRGRDVVVDGSLGALALGQIFAAALGLPDHAVTTEQSTSVEQQASWAAEGRIEVHHLGPGGRFRYKLDIDLHHAAIDTACFPHLALQHGLTIAWCVDEDAPDDWRYHVVHPDGRVEVRCLVWRSTEDGNACSFPPSP